MGPARHTPVEMDANEFDDAPTAQRPKLTEELATALRDDDHAMDDDLDSPPRRRGTPRRV